MRDLFPSRRDRPPPKWAFPPPVLEPEPGPPDLGNFPPLRPWPMPQGLNMRERWESLRFPHPDGKGGTVYKVDRVAVDLAINGLKIKWLSAPPMSSRDNPPAPVVTSLSKSLTLLPLVEQWVQRGIVTGDLSVIPKIVFFSRLFFCHQKTGEICPILVLLFLDSFFFCILC